MNFLFDLYGTLLDIKTDESASSFWNGVAECLGETDGESVRAEYVERCDELARSFSDRLAEFDLLRVFEKMLEKRGMNAVAAPEFARKFRLLSRERIGTFPHVTEILGGLRERGAGVYLVSNAQTCFTLDELDECGLTPLFDGILISSDAGVKKPSPKIFGIAAEKFGIELADCVYVGNDMRDDVLGAHGAGLRTVYIETEQSGKYPELDLPKPDRVANDHGELKKILFEMTKDK